MYGSDKLSDFEVISIYDTCQNGSICYKVKHKITQKNYLWKAISMDIFSQEQKIGLLSEINAFSKLSCPHLLQYYGVILHKETNCGYLCMEHCPEGNLALLIKKLKKNKCFADEEFIWRVLYQACKALQILNKCNFKMILQNINSRNVFIDENNNIKLGNFDLMTDVSDAFESPDYVNSESILVRKYSKSAIWSLGCLIYELCTSEPLFDDDTIEHAVNKIKLGDLPKISDHYSTELQKIIDLMLNTDEEMNPSIESLLHHPVLVSHMSFSKTNLDSKINGLKDDKELTNLDYDFLKKELLLKLENLRKKESALKIREENVNEKQRILTCKEKQIALKERLVNEKIARAELYLKTCRTSKTSIFGSRLGFSKKKSKFKYEDLDTSLSADPGDTSILPTSSKINMEKIEKPKPFQRSSSERRVKFKTKYQNDSCTSKDDNFVTNETNQNVVNKLIVSCNEQMKNFCISDEKNIHYKQEIQPDCTYKNHGRKCASQDLQMDSLKIGVLSEINGNKAGSDIVDVRFKKPMLRQCQSATFDPALFKPNSWTEESKKQAFDLLKILKSELDEKENISATFKIPGKKLKEKDKMNLKKSTYF